MNTTYTKKSRSYVTNIYSKSNLRIEILISIIRQNYKPSGKKKKMRKIEKNLTITILTKNNDIYNTGIVTSNGKAIYVFMV